MSSALKSSLCYLGPIPINHYSRKALLTRSERLLPPSGEGKKALTSVN
jgi:hypothetical protein